MTQGTAQLLFAPKLGHKIHLQAIMKLFRVWVPSNEGPECSDELKGSAANCKIDWTRT